MSKKCKKSRRNRFQQWIKTRISKSEIFTLLNNGKLSVAVFSCITVIIYILQIP